MTPPARWYAAAACVGLAVPNGLALVYALGPGWPPRMGAWLGAIFPNVLGAAFSADAIWAALFFASWMAVEGRRDPKLRWRMHSLTALIFGVAFALPFFLFVKERA